MVIYDLVERRISIHAAREGGDSDVYGILAVLNISIHAAREGGDVLYRPFVGADVISIHAAREGGDGRRQKSRCEATNFNPRRP